MPATEPLNDNLRFYRDQIGEASARSRTALYLSLASCCLVALFLYNEWSFRTGWKNAVIEFQANESRYLDANGEKARLVPGLFKEDYYEVLASAVEGDWAAYYYLDTQEKAKLSKERLKGLDDARFQTLTGDGYKIPVLDVSVNQNDIPLIASLQFVIVVWFFCYCLLGYRENILLGLRKAEECGNSEEFYDQICALLVFPAPKKEFPAVLRIVVKFIPMLALSIPALIQAYMAIQYWQAAPMYMIVAPDLYVPALVIQFFCILLILPGLAWSLRIYLETNKALSAPGLGGSR